jgi:hypothetical protein
MNWMRKHIHGAKPPDYAKSVLSRYRLGIKAGGAIAGVRVVPTLDSCSACLALGGRIYDPDTAPLIPVAHCANLVGCRCAYAAVMAYEMVGWQVDHRPKGTDYADSVLARYRLGFKAGGAIGGVRVVAAEDGCPACQALVGSVYDPSKAPRIPVASCTSAGGCRCAYATVMAYNVPGSRGSSGTPAQG